MVGSGKVTKVGSVPKLVAYWIPAMRTGAESAPPVEIVSPIRSVVRLPRKSRASAVSSRVTSGEEVRSWSRKLDRPVLPA